MADQTHDPRLETLLRDVLSAEVASLPLTVRPSQIVERAEARRRARARSRLRLLIFGEPTGGLRQLSVALGAIGVLAVAGALAFATLRPDRTPVGAPLPTTPDAWSRVVIDSAVDGGVESLVATPRGLLARVGGEDEPRVYFSVDGRTWTKVPADQIPNLDNPSFAVSGAAVAGDDQRFLMAGREVLASEDGMHWSPSHDPDVRQGAIIDLASGGPGFVAVGARNKAWYSADGTDWSLAEVPPPPGEPSVLARPLDRTQTQGTVEMEGIAVSGGDLLAWGKSIWVHDDGSATFVPVFWTSNDGLSWTNQKPPDPAWDYPNVTGGPNGFLAAAERGPIWLSADGQSWERVAGNQFATSGAAEEVFSHPIAAGRTGYVAAGGLHDPLDSTCEFFACPSEEAVIWTSPDGRSWTRLPSDELFGGNASDQQAGADLVTTWGDGFVVGGSYGDRPAIWISEEAER